MSEPNERSGFSQLLAEMRRRHVGRFVLGYAASAFVILQLAEIVLPAFGMGEGGLRFVVAAAALGFPPALLLAWVYDLSREGITRTAKGSTGPWLRSVTLGGLLVITVLATGGAGLYLARQGVFEEAAPATTTGGNRAPALQPASFDPSEPINAIAVLPITDNSPDVEQAYFAASMHEELIAKLSLIEELRVVSRTSMMRYGDSELTIPEIAGELGVDVLVEGSVIRTPERTRVTLQLIHGPTDSHIRTLQWDRERIDDVLAFQTEVAHDVVEAVLTQHDEEVFTTAASDVDPAAQEAYFRGRWEYDRGTAEGYLTALQHFEEALEQDPDFAQAMAGMAGARFLGTLEDEQVSPEALMQAYDEAEAALAMDSTSSETREVFALIERSLPMLMDNVPTAPTPSTESQSVRVVRIPGTPDSIMVDVSALDTAWVAPVTTLGGRIEAQIRRQTEATGEASAAHMTFDARQLLASGRYAEAAAVLDEAVALTPDSFGAWDMLVRTHVSRRDQEAALDAVRRWSESGAVGVDAEAAAELEAALTRDGMRGYWTWRLDRLEEAEAAGQPAPSFEVASTHAALGNEEAAVQHLVRALRQGEPGVMSIRNDPVWDDLRADPRLRELLRAALRIRFAPGRRSGRGGDVG